MRARFSDRFRISSLLVSLLGTSLALANPAGLAKSSIGVNGHSMFASGVYRQINDEDLFRYLQSRKIKQYRFSIPLADDTDPWTKTRFRSLITLAKTYGVTLQPVLMLPLSWGDKTDGGRFPAGDSTALYNQGYRRVNDFVSVFAKDVRDWELQNEVNLLALDSSGNRLFGKGWTASEFSSLPVMTNFASLLKGMSDAIDNINTSQGTKLRRIVGTTSTMFGYLDFVKASGVKIDIVGYHYYERLGVDPNNYWGGVRPTFNLFEKLGSYGVPVHVNEINCGEIYDASYTNVAGSSSMEACRQNIDYLLNTFTAQTKANIENLIVYELLDQPSQVGAESRFGILFNLSSEKPMATVVASYAAAATAPIPVSITYSPSSVEVINGKSLGIMTPTLSGISGSPLCVATNLPAGLSINASTCAISGVVNVTGTIPTAGLSFSVTVKANNSGASTKVTILVKPVPPVVTNPDIVFPNPVALKNKVASTVTPTVSNMTGSLNCVGVLLPTGMSINYDTCVISGAPNYSSSTATVVTSTIIAKNGLVKIVNFQINP